MEHRPAILDDLQNFLSDSLDRFSIVAITDVKGVILYANDNFCKISGYAREELVGETHRLLNSGFHDSDFFEDLWSTILSGNNWRGEVCNRSKLGRRYWVETHVTPVDFEGEQFFIAVRYDISDRKKAEAENFKREKQLLQADKMASLGILTSGVAHEINNPNHLILSNNELLEKVWFDIQKVLETQCQEQGDFDLAGVPYSEMKALIPQMFDRVRGGSERISNIVDGLKNFAREDQIGMDQRVDLNEVISKSLPLVDRLIKKSTDHFSLDLEDKLPVIRGSFQQMEQVFINFVTNACQALTSREQSITVHTFCTHASVGLSVCDEGSGLDENVQKKVMDPFFTTKHDQGGTGLGLFVTYGIVQRHRGELQLTSQDQQGCCARVTFPKCGHQGWGIER